VDKFHKKQHIEVYIKIRLRTVIKA